MGDLRERIAEAIWNNHRIDATPWAQAGAVGRRLYLADADAAIQVMNAPRRVIDMETREPVQSNPKEDAMSDTTETETVGPERCDVHQPCCRNPFCVNAGSWGPAFKDNLVDSGSGGDGS